MAKLLEIDTARLQLRQWRPGDREPFADPRVMDSTQVTRAVMRKLSMQEDAQGLFEHPGVPEGHWLRQPCLYRLSREDWRRKPAQGDGAGDSRPRGVLLLSLGHEVERTAEACRIAGGEEMLRELDN